MDNNITANNTKIDRYKNERYEKLQVGDKVFLNIAHFQNQMISDTTKYCKLLIDTDWDKNTDCDYPVYILTNKDGDYCCGTSILYPEDCCDIIEKTDSYIVLKECDIDSCQFTLTKDEFFYAASKYDGWDWVINF